MYELMPNEKKFVQIIEISVQIFGYIDFYLYICGGFLLRICFCSLVYLVCARHALNVKVKVRIFNEQLLKLNKYFSHIINNTMATVLINCLILLFLFIWFVVIVLCTILYFRNRNESLF